MARAYAVQMHLHGSNSEGSGGYLAHDYEAAATGAVDLIWWTDHDFRVANFAKVMGFAFDDLVEQAVLPNRRPTPEQPTMTAEMSWEPYPMDGAPPQASAAEIVTDVVRTGSASLRIALPARTPAADDDHRPGQRHAMYRFATAVQYNRFPLLSRPRVRLAIYPRSGVGPEAAVLVRFVLSEQPPDLRSPTLTYQIGGAATAQAVDGYDAVVPCAWTPGAWNVYEFDLAADVERVGVPGGMDNSLHDTVIGVRSAGPAIEAYFDSLQYEPAVKGTAVLDLHRQLLATLPTRVKHLVGVEVSFYGRHVNAFGSNVPIPDYEGLLPNALTTEEVVAHIHRHDGLACLNHPGAVDVESTAAALAEARVYGADLMEVAHGTQWTMERLRLWDRLASLGVIVTGLGVSDAHTATQGWREQTPGTAHWVTRIWADSLDELDLLAALGRGRVFFANPAQFRGDLDLEGPGGAQMGDLVVVGASRSGQGEGAADGDARGGYSPSGRAAPPIRATVTGLRPGDLVAWYCNGYLAHAAAVAGDAYDESWTPAAPVVGLQAIRIQLHRPALAHARYGGLIACSNPIYLAVEAPATTHGVIRLS